MAMRDQQTLLSPAAFCRHLLRTIDESDRRRKRRKRDTRPDGIGFRIKRELLARAADEEPSSDEFEGWLMQQVEAAPAGGPVHAICSEIMAEYEAATFDPSYAEWLASDQETEPPGKSRS